MAYQGDRIKPISPRERDNWLKHFESLFERDSELYTTEDMARYLGDTHPIVLNKVTRNSEKEESTQHEMDCPWRTNSTELEEAISSSSPFTSEEICPFSPFNPFSPFPS